MRLNLKVIFLTFCHLVILNSIIGSNLAIYLSTQYAYFVPLLLGGVTIILFLLLVFGYSYYKLLLYLDFSSSRPIALFGISYRG